MILKNKIWLGIAIVGGIGALINYGALDFDLGGAFCSYGENNCFRHWVWALGPWAVFPAAAVGAYYVSRQIRESDRRQRETAANTEAQLKIIAKLLADRKD